jgi:hypothetical protein
MKLLRSSETIGELAVQGYIDQGLTQCYNAPVEEQRQCMIDSTSKCLRSELDGAEMVMTKAEMLAIMDSAEACALTNYHRTFRDRFTVDKLPTPVAQKCLKQRDIFDEGVALGF